MYANYHPPPLPHQREREIYVLQNGLISGLISSCLMKLDILFVADLVPRDLIILDEPRSTSPQRRGEKCCEGAEGARTLQVVQSHHSRVGHELSLY